ncbi:hypothetical protein [Actinospica robiniae]|uniref:hypothetical protein n=1 Tax=Actinospica robiniae TaxID=304901 RepID=UPI00041A316B|nr:hypothetical protein [Actinospica robiniae]
MVDERGEDGGADLAGCRVRGEFAIEESKHADPVDVLILGVAEAGAHQRRHQIDHQEQVGEDLAVVRDVRLVVEFERGERRHETVDEVDGLFTHVGQSNSG